MNFLMIKNDFKKLFDEENKKTAIDFVRFFSLRIFQLSLSLATFYVLIRALSKEQYGEYHYILGCVGMLTIFGLPGLLDSVMQAIARGFPGMYRVGAKWSLICSFIAVFILLAIATWHLFFDEQKTLTTGIFIAAILFPLTHGMNIWKAERHGHSDFKTLRNIEGANSFLIGALIIAGTIFFPGNILIPIVIVMGIPGLQNLIQTIKTYKKTNPEASAEPGNLKFGVKTSFYSGASIFANHVDKILLFNFLSPEALAIFMAAQKLTEPVHGIVQDLAAVMAPRFAKFKHLSDNMDRAFFYISLIFGTGIIIFSFTILPPILILIFGEQYAEAIPYCQALMCALAVGNIGTLRFRFIRSRMSIDSVRRITFSNALFRIVSTSILIPTFGILGAVIATALARAALTLQIDFDIKKFRENP